MLDGAVIRRVADVGTQDEATRRRVRRLDILAIGADIADMRKGEIDDLAGIGGIGQDLLIAGHRGIEADLAERRAVRADATSPPHAAVAEHQGGVAVGRPPCRPG